MAFSQKLRTVNAIIKRLLEKHPELRDSDEKLTSYVWYEEVTELYRKDGVWNGSWKELLRLMYDGKLTSGATITRARAKIQQHNPLLRGKYYNERHEIEQPKVITEMRREGDIFARIGDD